MSEPVTVVVIYSLSYTGTTWLNLVLGSHPDAFALGPCDRPIGLAKDKAAEACRVHGADCSFWPRFYETLGDENFFIHLARVSGKRVIVTNNPLPQGGAQLLNHPDILVKPIHLVRDGRAIADSYAAKFPEKSFLEVCREWLAPSFDSVQWDPDDPDRLCLRYEDVLADQRGMLERVGRFIGLEYDESALRFWEHEHHPAAGNQGPMFMIKLFQGLPVAAHGRDRAFYQEQYDKLLADPNHQFQADRWQERRSDRDLFVFDAICGRRNSQFGYERDRFTVDQWMTFSREFAQALDGLPALKTSDKSLHAPLSKMRGPSTLLRSTLSPAGVSGSEAPSSTSRRGVSVGAVVAVIVFGVTLGIVSILAATGVFG